MPGRLTVRPVTDETWEDFARLFSARGCPHFCWCTPYRFRDAHGMGKGQKRAAMRRLVGTGTPVGLLAYRGGEPVGWCSVAPRESYAKLERSKTMPRVDGRPTWTILCLFVRRDERGTGVTQRLVKEAVAYARRSGAAVVEAYPFDSAGITSRHRGHSSIYEGAGFEREGWRWSRAVRPARRRATAAAKA